MYPLKLYSRHPCTLVCTGLAAVLNTGMWLWLLQIQPQADAIFLHYNILFGVDAIGDWIHIFAIPFLGLLIIIVNVTLGWILFSRDKYMSHFLNITSIMCQILLFAAAILLVALNV